MADLPDLRHVPLFKGLTSAELERLARNCVRLEPRDGSEVFAQGDPANAVYAIVAGDGRVRIIATDRRSKALLAEIFHNGDCFGEMGVMDGGTRSAGAIAEGRVVLLRINATTFLHLLATNPTVGDALSRILVRRLRRTFEMCQDATFETLEVRLARQVLYLMEREGRAQAQGVRITRRFRQGELADLLGTTTRSIITILNAWRASGVVTYDVNQAVLIVPDPANLRAIVDTAPY